MGKKYILTGGPCSGKTTLLNELARQGYQTVPEAARMIIDYQQATGGNILPWTDREAFQKAVIRVQLSLEARLRDETTFLDRGLADGLAYYKLDGVEPPRELTEAVRDNGYEKVFFLEQRQEYQQDDARKEDEEEARRIGELLKKTYQELGYEVIDLPMLDEPEERAELLKEYLQQED
jgi:predicted ATPase